MSKLKDSSRVAPSLEVSRASTPLPGIGGASHTEHADGGLKKTTSFTGKRSRITNATLPEEKEAVRAWISQNIKMKVCCWYMESSTAGVCECRHPRSEHASTALRKPTLLGEKWEPAKHTAKEPTNAFGDIQFTGLGQRLGKFVRVGNDTEPSVLFKLMMEHWHLDVPNLLISVTGGAKNFHLKPQLRTMFRHGLNKTARSTGAWIITGGSYAGVMKYVGESVRDFALASGSKEGKIVAIGIATWGIIHNKGHLIDAQGKFPAEYPMDEAGQGRLSCLDNNHSHFILVDNGTHGQYGVEIVLRARLEQYISTQHTGSGGVGSVQIPIVCLVLEGGVGTLDTMFNAMNNNTPCVVVEGSGRVADVIASVAALPPTGITLAVIREQLHNFLGKEAESFSEARIAELTSKIQDIVNMSHLLTVFDDKEGGPGIDVAILKALLKASRGEANKAQESCDHQLRLALAWNRVDIATSEIFTDDRKWQTGDLEQVMDAALLENRPEFVSLFVEHGLILREYLTWARLESLYNGAPASSLLHILLRRISEGEKSPADPHRRWISTLPMAPKRTNHFSLYHISLLIRELLGDSTSMLYGNKMSRFSKLSPNSKNTGSTKVRIIIRTLYFDWRNPMSCQALCHRSILKGVHMWLLYCPDPERDLFIWAVLLNRRELANFFWSQGKDCMAAALMASKLLKAMVQEEDDSDRTSDMLAQADNYEQLAIGLLDECYKDDELRAQKLLIRQLHSWGGATCLSMAYHANNKSFFSHSGVQALLTQIWWGGMSVDLKTWRVILCIIFPLLIYTRIITFRWRSLTITMFQRWRNFWTAPITVFWANVVSYFIFLWLFAYVIIMDFQYTPDWPEYLLYAWVLSLILEELRQVFTDPEKAGQWKAAVRYIKDIWNRIDMLALLLFTIGVICRLIPNSINESTFQAGRSVLCVDYMVFCLRLMHIFTVNKTLGPKIIIVKRMVKDIFFFLFLLGVWVVAYGVATQGILILNEQRLDWIFRGVVYQPYLLIFGQFPTRVDSTTFDTTSCTNNGINTSQPRCPVLGVDWLTILLTCLYLLFANILLLNLLIAMFNYTFQLVQDNTDTIWKFQRYELVNEYHSRPSLAPPLIVFSHVYLFVRRFILKKPQHKHEDFKKGFSESEEREFLAWESIMRESYVASQLTEKSQRLEERIKSTAEKMDSVMQFLDVSGEGRTAALEVRLHQIEEKLGITVDALDWITKALCEKGIGTKETRPALKSARTKESTEKRESRVTSSNQP
ncbi:unnamed protein product, partial [Lampetra planeri]